MSPSYKEVNTGQIVVSDTIREDLEKLARWQHTDETPVPVDDKPKPLASMTAKDLKDYAVLHGIDLGDAKKRDEILAVIAAAVQANENADGPVDEKAGDEQTPTEGSENENPATT